MQISRFPRKLRSGKYLFNFFSTEEVKGYVAPNGDILIVAIHMPEHFSPGTDPKECWVESVDIKEVYKWMDKWASDPITASVLPYYLVVDILIPDLKAHSSSQDDSPPMIESKFIRYFSSIESAYLYMRNKYHKEEIWKDAIIRRERILNRDEAVVWKTGDSISLKQVYRMEAA